MKMRPDHSDRTRRVAEARPCVPANHSRPVNAEPGPELPKPMPAIILQRVQRSCYCHREMDVPPLGFAENPFCTVCLPERMALATPATGFEWERGNYMAAVPGPGNMR